MASSLSSVVKTKKTDDDDDDDLLTSIGSGSGVDPDLADVTFEKDPVAAWGLVIEAFGAGFKGQESLISKSKRAKKKQKLLEQAQEFKTKKLQIDGLKHMAELAGDKNMDPGIKTKLLGSFKKLYSDATGMDESQFEGIEKFADPLRQQVLGESATLKVKSLLEGATTMGAKLPDKLDFGTILTENAKIPDGHPAKLDEDELRSIVSNPTVQYNLGLVMGENAGKALETYVTTKAQADAKLASDKARSQFDITQKGAEADAAARAQARYREPPADILMAPPNNPTGGRMVTPNSPEYQTLKAQGWVKTTPSQVTGDASSFAVTKPEQREWRTAHMGAMNYVQTATQLRDLVQDNPQSLFVAGNVAQFANSFAATADGLLRLGAEAAGVSGPKFFATQDGKLVESTGAQMMESVAVKLRKEGFFDTLAKQMRDAFQNTAIDAKQIEALVLNLAYADAVANEGGAGRLSDQDIEKAVKQLGVSADPVVFAKGIENAIDRQVRQLGNRAKVLNTTLSPDQRLPVPTKEELGYTPPKAKSPRGGYKLPDGRELEEGTLITQNGRNFVVRGGKVVPR